MDQSLTTMVAGVVPALLPYLPIIATKAAEKVGEGLPEGVSKLWTSLKTRFSKGQASKEALDDLLKKPDDPDLQAAFRVQLRKLAEADPEFQAELRAFLNGEQAKAVTISSQSGTANISVQGSNNSVAQNIGQIAHNVTNLGYQPKQIPVELVNEFIATMRALRPVKVHITSNMLDHKTQFLADQLADLLQKAGWDASGESQSLYGPEMPKGIVYIAPQGADSTSIDVLAGFLAKLGFPYYKFLDPNARMFTIVINGV
jgi:hypothetical protein